MPLMRRYFLEKWTSNPAFFTTLQVSEGSSNQISLHWRSFLEEQIINHALFIAQTVSEVSVLYSRNDCSTCVLPTIWNKFSCASTLVFFPQGMNVRTCVLYCIPSSRSKLFLAYRSILEKWCSLQVFGVLSSRNGSSVLLSLQHF